MIYEKTVHMNDVCVCLYVCVYLGPQLEIHKTYINTHT